MSKVTRRPDVERYADPLMIALCCVTSLCVLASPLVSYTFDLTTGIGMITFLGADLVLSSVLSGTGVVLNHRVSRPESLSIRRRRE